jgi:hypothetical protein
MTRASKRIWASTIKAKMARTLITLRARRLTKDQL